MTNIEKINELKERQTHYETMKFSANDNQLLNDMEQHSQSLSDDERDYWNNAEFYE